MSPPEQWKAEEVGRVSGQGCSRPHSDQLKLPRISIDQAFSKSRHSVPHDISHRTKLKDPLQWNVLERTLSAEGASRNEGSSRTWRDP